MTKEEKKIQDNMKALIVDQLSKTPIIQAVCEKINIGRSTFYRWKAEDVEFSKAVDEALAEGTAFVSDVAESRLIEAIRDKNLRAIFFWLKSHSSRYATKVELNGSLRIQNEPLTEEQQVIITKALKLSGLIPNDNKTL